MVDKVIGFLTLKGWTGVENIYLMVAIGTFIGMGMLYYLLLYQKEYKPPRLTPIQSYIVKIVVVLIVLILLLTH